MKRIVRYIPILLLLIIGCDDQFSIAPGNESSGVNNTSKGGSTARFAIKENILYVVDDQNLNVFDITDQSTSVLLDQMSVGWGIETIFPFENLLFLGTQSGVEILDISTPSEPTYISRYSHIVACDPVVTDGRYAYLTLRTGTACGRPVNELHVLDLENIDSPELINIVQMDNPKGLALNGNTLFVCDDGIKILDVSNPIDIHMIDQIENVPANDVIYHNNQLLVTANDGFYQFNTNDFTRLSHYTY